jgi:hypothetical protein
MAVTAEETVVNSMATSTPIIVETVVAAIRAKADIRVMAVVVVVIKERMVVVVATTIIS